MTRTLLSIVAAVLFLGCNPSDPIVGEWQNEANANDDLNLTTSYSSRDSLYSGRLSDGTIYNIDINYEADWQRVATGEYDVQFDCVSATLTIGTSTEIRGCTDVAIALDFTSLIYDTECELDSARGQLTCQQTATSTPEVFEER
jgi:hypothetical protein